MSELEQSPAPVTANDAATGLMPMPSINMDWPADGSDPVITSTGQDYADEPEETPEPAPPAEQPEATSDAPPPQAEEPEQPALDFAAFENLTPQQIREALKKNPAFLRAYDGEIGSRLQAKERELREQARAEAIAEFNAEGERLAAAWEQYEEIEGWRDTDPEKYERETGNNPAYDRWKANLKEWRKAYEDKTKIRPRAADAAPPVDEVAILAKWSSDGAEEAKHIIKSVTPFYANLPAENRKAIESLTFSPDRNWLEDALTNYVKGTEVHFEKRMKEAVEAAREAGRNEALAEREVDTPVQVSSAPKSSRSARQVLIEHAQNGFRTGVTQEELDRAKQEIGI